MTIRAPKKPFIIAVDGVNAAGKGTISKEIAKHYGFSYLDTGKLYRLVAYNLIKHDINTDDIHKIMPIIATIDFNHKVVNASLDSEEIGQIASKIAAFGEIRRALLHLQRDFPQGKKGAVLDGRDIGTIIFPNADIKFFVTASLEERARRRLEQLQSHNKDIKYEDVLREIRIRDERDANREHCPCVPAKDAIILDNTNSTPEQSIKQAISYIDEKLGGL